MEQLDKAGSAGFLFGFAALFCALVVHFNPALAFVLTLFVFIVGIVLVYSFNKGC